MPTRDQAPLGAPCWTDLWTSDVEGSRRFYAELFGWEAGEGSPEFDGYFMFSRDGVPVAGAMGPMGDQPASDTWKIYLATDDVAATVERAAAAGAQVLVPPVPVADLGVQAVLLDPHRAQVGAWQAGTFPGFTVLAEVGAPSWFELHTDHHDEAVAFYRATFGWETGVVGDTDEFRYTTVLEPGTGAEVAGVFDAAAQLGGARSAWTTYWQVADADRSAARVAELGGAVLDEPKDSPYGRMATVADPTGATFRLHGPTA